MVFFRLSADVGLGRGQMEDIFSLRSAPSQHQVVSPLFFLTGHTTIHKKCDSAELQNPEKIMKIHKELIKRSRKDVPEEAISVGKILLQVTELSPSGVFCFHLFIKQLRE